MVWKKVKFLPPSGFRAPFRNRWALTAELDSARSTGILSRPVNGVFADERSSGHELPGQRHKSCMKRQYQPSKIRRKRQHGFLNRNASKSGRAILRNRRRVGRKRLTPV